MRRWAIAKLGDYDNEGTTVPAFNKYTQSSRIWHKKGFAWCFGELEASDLTAINADPDIYVIPAAALDNALSSIPSATRTVLRNKLEAAGFSFVGVQNSWTGRELLLFLRAQLQPALTSDIEDGYIGPAT